MKKVILLAIDFVFCICMAFLFYEYVPGRIEGKVTASEIYEDMRMSESDFSVESVTLSGRRTPVSDFRAIVSNRNHDADLYYGKDFSVNVNIDSVRMTMFDVSYDGDTKAGSAIDPHAFTVSAKYEDGAYRQITDYTVSVTQPVLVSDCTAILHTSVGDPIVPIDVEEAEELVFTYGDGSAVHVGDPFDASLFKGKLVFSDGTSRDAGSVMPVVFPDESYFVNTRDVPVVCYYGIGYCHVDCIPVRVVLSSYESDVYEGDFLSSKNMKLNVVFEDDLSIPVTDFTYDYHSRIRSKTNVVVHSIYGDSTLYINPIRVSDVSVICNNLPTAGERAVIDGLHIVYQDGRELDLSSDEFIVLTSDLTMMEGLNSVWVSYNDIRYEVFVEAQAAPMLLPEITADMHTEDADDGIYLEDEVLNFDAFSDWDGGTISDDGIIIENDML